MSKNQIDEVCKYYELRENQKLMNGLPVVIRLDGKNFHTFTKGMARPYDERLSSLMLESLRFCMAETSAVFGYTQSDEISLLLWNPEGDIYFSGKHYKINSILASTLSLVFNNSLDDFGVPRKNFDPVFDCRCWALPKEQVATTFKWRYIDAIRNSVQMAARANFSHTECHKKSTKELHEMLYGKGINWANYPNFFKNGQFLAKVRESKQFTAEEIEKLPLNHNARKDKDLTVTRNVIKKMDITNSRDLTDYINSLFK